MTKFGKKIIFIFIMLLSISLMCILCMMPYIGGSSGTVMHRENDSSVSVKTACSFYPQYVIALNLLKDIDNVSVVNITSNVTGCIHDYELTTDNLRTLSDADVLFINGGGMEEFTLKATESVKDLKICDVSSDFEYAYENPHYWMDFNLYINQVLSMDSYLVSLCGNGMTDSLAENARNYIDRIRAMQMKYDRLDLSGIPVVTFHEALETLAQYMGMDVKKSIDMDYDTALSAGDMKETEDIIRKNHVKYIFAAEGFSTAAEKVAGDTDTTVIYLNPGVTLYKDGSVNGTFTDEDSYINMADGNLQELGKIVD